ncbi:MAG: S4 domain-containing protein, partial [Gemmatimonadaceae bacterium]
MTGAAAAGTHHEFTVDEDDAPRLDLLVAQRLDLSRSQAATLVANGLVLVDGKRARASFRAARGARIAGDVPPPPGREVN